MGIEHCRLLEFPIVADPRGNLTFVESNRHIPFEIKRVYYLYDVPGGAEHGTRCLEGGHLLDVFTPQREDFLKK